MPGKYAFLLLSFLLTLLSCQFPRQYMPGGTYYVDAENGNDASDGLSPGTAWRSIEKINSLVFGPGSTVLFRAGGVYRGSLKPSSGTDEGRNVYTSYGDGDRPVLQNSLDLSAPGDWENKDGGLWQYRRTISTDIGNIIFDGETCGVRRWSKEELTADLDFCYDGLWNRLYLWSSTDPSDRFASIEAALTGHIIDFSDTSFVDFSELTLRYGGAHGFGGGGTRGVTISNCEMYLIGGGLLHYDGGIPVRYGNGIEFWGSAKDNLVEGCYIHDIYDTGLTNQNYSTTVTQENIIYRNNIVENCALASFEFWNRPAASSMKNIIFEHNTSINPGGTPFRGGRLSV